jgi:hypothetical protein
MPEAQEKSFDKISGMLLYVSLNKPVKAFQDASTGPKPDEWKASVCITDEDYLDEFEAYAAGIDAKVSIKKVKKADFEAKYKVAPPEDAAKNIWIVTFRKSTQLGKTGREVPDLYKPKVFEKVGKTLVDVTNSKLPGNGSYGTISTELFTRQNGTSSIYLKNIMVTDMIEYVPEDGEAYEPGSEFGDAYAAPAKAAPAPTTTKATVKPPAKKAKPPVDYEDDLDIPF